MVNANLENLETNPVIFEVSTCAFRGNLNTVKFKLFFQSTKKRMVLNLVYSIKYVRIGIICSRLIFKSLSCGLQCLQKSSHPCVFVKKTRYLLYHLTNEAILRGVRMVVKGCRESVISVPQ